jgi:ribosomal protein S8
MSQFHLGSLFRLYTCHSFHTCFSERLYAHIYLSPCVLDHVWLGYIGEFEIIDDHRASKIVVELVGRLNKCGVISPRFDVQLDEIEKWIVNLLPSRQFGHILLSTTYGIMTHEEARRRKTGGKVLGFFY